MDAKIKEKRWDKTLEDAIYKEWVENEPYNFTEESDKPVYFIDTPPPYINTPIHMGHAATYSIQDMIARFKRMLGYNVLFPIGFDRNGLPIETQVEKEYGKKLTETPREEFLQLCEESINKANAVSRDSLQRLGISYNTWKDTGTPGSVYFTDAKEYRALTQSIFIELYEKGLIYEDKRITNYCPGCQTTIADSEIIYEDAPSKFNDVKFKVKETGEEIIIGTTRPELIPSCGMVIFNPEDERYHELKGKTAITPLFEKEVPIQAHPMADKDKGTGLVMMCSAGDLTDIRFFREQNLEPMISINKDGTMNENAGFLEGLPVKKAREKIIHDLKEKDLITGQKDVVHRTPICDRSKDHVEFIETEELYVKQLEFKDDLLKIARDPKFYDEKSRQILLDWVNSISIDWPISRSRYYATEVPLWYCDECKKPLIPGKGEYYQPWKDSPPNGSECECGSKNFTGDTRVLDTWFDSSNTPFYNLQYSKDKDFFERHYPLGIRPQGKEIVRTWLYYTMLKGYLLTKKTCFDEVWIHHHIVDENGIKMSKSLGNIIDPQKILDEFGGEALRLWSVSEGNITKGDVRCSSEKIDGAKKTLTKLWNVARFISMFEEKEKPEKLQPLDEWIISELNELITLSRKEYENCEFSVPIQKTRNFLWDTFSSHYMELVKPRAYNRDEKFTQEEQDSALYTLHYCLLELLKLAAPITPMITYKLYKDLTGKDVHLQAFPEVKHEVAPKINTQTLELVNSEIWKAKKEQGLALNKEFQVKSLPEELKAIEKDLVSAHKLTSHAYGERLEI